MSDPASDLVAWLREQLDTDERLAHTADPGPWEVGPTFGARDNRVYVREQRDLIDSVGTCVIAGQVANKTRFRENARFIAEFDPARVLREVEAKRLLLEEVERELADDPTNETAQWKARVLALPFSDRPGFREAWKL